jgi:hypothetical protein
MKQFIALILGVLTILVFGLAGWVIIRRRRTRLPDPATADRQLQEHRLRLEQQFFELASSSGKPRGLRWKSCEFGSQRTFLQDCRSGELLALLPITIAFEAIPGSDMEGLPAVGNLRCGSAVFAWRGRWVATGRTILNLSPAEVVQHFAPRYQLWGSAAGSNPE